MPRPKPQYSFRKKQCQFCRRKVDRIDFRDVGLLMKFLSSWSKIKAGRDTGTCSRHQRELSDAIKRARFMALMPYVRP
ncbi:MAG: rpsR [Candidatus Berkelbacteria bacterium]|nr:rpsR [Candidatus Berkelbacteria bacterium]